MSKEIEITVDALLASFGVTYGAIYRGVKANALGGKSDMDQWSVSFTKGDGREAHEEFDYYTGLGHREIVRGLKAMRFPGAEHKNGNWQVAKPVSPPAAGVLSCLLLSMEALDTSFRNWCDDFGYDNDSIKARDLYDECQKEGEKLERVFNRDQIEQLREALQDY